MNLPNTFIIRRRALASFRKRFPFLKSLPDDLYLSLDPSDWYESFGAIEQARQELEELLPCYVMTYRKQAQKYIPLEKHLHSRIAGANLSDEQWGVLIANTRRFLSMGIRFVPYAKPLMIIPLSEVIRNPCELPKDIHV